LRRAGASAKAGERIKVAAGSESLWLGERWTLGLPLTLPSPAEGEEE